MSAPRFAVETVLSGVGVLTDNIALGDKISAALSARSFEPVVLTPTNPNPPNPESLELYLIFLTPSLADYLFKEGRGVLEHLSSSHLKIYVVQNYFHKVPLALPDTAYQITLGEYLGLDGQGAPFLYNLFSTLTSEKKLLLSGTGIEPYALMSESYVLSGISDILASSHVTNHFFLHNPDTVSLSNLSHHLISLLPYSVAFGYGSGLTAPTLPRTTHVENTSIESTLTLSAQAFEQYLADSTSPFPATLAPTRSALDESISFRPELSLPTSPPPSDPQTRASSLEAPPPSKPTISSFSLPPLPRLGTLVKPPRHSLTTLEFVPTQARPSLSLSRVRGKGLKIVARGLLIGLVLYLGSLSLALGISYLTLKNLHATLSAGDYSTLTPSQPAFLAGKYLEANASVFGLQEPTLLFNAYNQGLSIGTTLSTLDNQLRGLANYVFTDKGDNVASSISQARLLTEDLYQQVSLLDGTLPALTPKLLATRYDSQYQKLKTALTPVKKNILIGKAALSIMPDFLGLGGRAKYAVLFQNNMELRSTGGFIGSFAIMSFENGKLYDLPLYDVYSADGQLKGHVEPPTPIKEVLGEANWYLRDSNFDPDFPTSARRAEWFLKKTMNQDVEGTIGINLEALKGLLIATGPLELPDYSETVSAGNLYERAQYHAEVNFFPGSTAKKEYLSAVSDSLFNKLKGGSSGVLIKALLSLTESLEQNNVQLSVSNANTEHVLDTLGWNGEVASKPCSTTPCYEDYFYQVDNNYGVNKANFYITRATSLNLTVSKDGTLSHQAEITWKNNATSNAWPAGTYKNYTRTYLPTHVSVQNIQVGDKVLSNKEYSTSIEHDKLVVAYLVSVPVGESVTVKINYRSATPLISGTHYTLYHQKQSGIPASDLVKISLAYPLFYKPTQISPAATILPQQLVFEFGNDTDHRLDVQF